jgi:hypothetical protein
MGGERFRKLISAAGQLKCGLKGMAGSVNDAQAKRALVCLTRGEGADGKGKEDE